MPKFLQRVEVLDRKSGTHLGHGASLQFSRCAADAGSGGGAAIAVLPSRASSPDVLGPVFMNQGMASPTEHVPKYAMKGVHSTRLLLSSR